MNEVTVGVPFKKPLANGCLEAIGRDPLAASLAVVGTSTYSCSILNAIRELVTADSNPLGYGRKAAIAALSLTNSNVFVPHFF